jgi:HPt (histidine-containing phosphotransfer) domain-containing protein
VWFGEFEFMQRGILSAHSAVESGAFATPPGTIFDVAFFEHCTMGDKQLMIELIGLFKSQVEKTEIELMDITSDAKWRFLAHTLKGAASAIGAVEIETLASAWENRPAPKRFSEREALRATLEQVAKRFFVKAQAVLA